MRQRPWAVLASLIFLGVLAVAPAAAQVQDGSWQGTTGQGRTYAVVVQNNAVTQLAWSVSHGGCTVSGQTSGNAPISGSNSFSMSGGGICPSFNTSGTF